MASTPTALDVTILGKSYRVGCPPEQEAALTQAAQYLDKKMSEIAGTGKVTGGDRIAIMAALNIAHELFEAQKNVDAKDVPESVVEELETAMARMSNKIDQVQNGAGLMASEDAASNS